MAFAYVKMNEESKHRMDEKKNKQKPKIRRKVTVNWSGCPITEEMAKIFIGGL